MGLLLNTHLEVGAHNFLIVISFLVAAIYSISVIRKTWEDHHTLIGLLYHDTHRFLVGFTLMSVGVIARIGGWLGWRPYLYIPDVVGANNYKLYSILWTGTGDVMVVVGLSILMWPHLSERLGRFAFVKTVLLSIAIWWAGVAGTYCLALIYKCGLADLACAKQFILTAPILN